MMHDAYASDDKQHPCLQSAEHVIDGVMVKINRAGPRPEHEHPQDDKPQSTPSTACAVSSLPGSLVVIIPQ